MNEVIRQLYERKSVRVFEDREISAADRETILTAAAIIGCTYLIGMLPALGLFVVLWLKLVEHTPWKTTLIILAIVAALVIGVFVLWLGVRFPTGLIYEMIFNR